MIKFNVRFKVTVDKIAEFNEGVKVMDKRKVYVGVPGEESSRGEDMTNVSLAYIHDRGSPKANIPARPFLTPGIADVQADLVALMAKVAAAPDWNEAALMKTLNRAGLVAQTSVKKRIRSQEGFVPLSKATLRYRKSIGFTGKKALIHTGKLLNSISYVVREE